MKSEQIALKRCSAILTAALAWLLAVAAPSCSTPAETGQKAGAGRMKISSDAFQENQTIPKQYTADGKDVSPPLKWSAPPEKTESFALICDDPDAPFGTWVHWVLYDLPGSARELAEGIPAQQILPDGAKHGLNSWKKIGYGGPSPPPGKPHRYFFKLYALDVKLNLKPGATREQVLSAMKGHELGEAQVMGTYGR